MPPQAPSEGKYLDTLKPKKKSPVLPDAQEPLPDLSSSVDPRRQREPRQDVQPLTLYGYEFFKAPRQIIDARQAYFQRLSAPELKAVVTETKIDEKARTAVAALTDEQKLDLLLRRREGKLTPEERIRYRALFAPEQGEPGAATTTTTTETVEDLSHTLTTQQKIDLLTRQSQGKLTEEEKIRYRAFLFPKAKEEVTKTVPVPGLLTTETPEDLSDPRLRLPPFNAFQSPADPLSTILQNIVASAPTNYQLAGGDTILLRFWSPTLLAQEVTLTVDPQGGINVPNVGRVIVRGQALAQAEKTLRERMRQVYRDVEVSLTLQELRTIPITVGGQSYYPGTYTVPAVVTAFNMIYATGGPTENGTLRRVEVWRRGKIFGVIDLYKFLVTGDQTGDIPLEPGDVIYIPPRRTRVGVRGEVRLPAIFELLDSETLKDALRYAGGVKPSGVIQRVQISTLQPGNSRVLKDVDFSDPKNDIPVYDGDTIEIYSVRTRLVNKVTIEGAVDQPSEYELTPNMTIADLVERARGLLSEAYSVRADLYRYNPDNTLTLIPVNLEKALARDAKENLLLTRWDRLRIYTRDEVAWTGRREVTVRGAIKNPAVYYRADNMRVKDLLLQAGGLLPEADTKQAVLMHQYADGSYSYEYINLTEALQDDPKHNVLLQDHDILAIYRIDEVRFTPVHTFSIQGEVQFPGVYNRGENMRLSDALVLAGGLTPRAGMRIQIAHARKDEGQEPVIVTYNPSSGLPEPNPLLEDGDLITIQGRGSFREKPAVVFVEGAVNRPGPVILRKPDQRLSEVIKEVGGLKPEAFPQGIEFIRHPDLLFTAGQRQITSVVSRLLDIINQAEYKREQAKSDVERIEAVANASSKSGAFIDLPGLPSLGGGPTVAPLSSAAIQSLFGRDLVPAPRVLKEEDLNVRSNVAVDLSVAMKRPGSEEDIVVVDGDRIIVPEKPTTVQVIGAVIEGRAVLHRPGANLDYYISQAGGYTPDAARDRVIVIRYGGGLIPVKKVKSFQPGDVILVPTRVLAERLIRRASETEQALQKLTGTALFFGIVARLLRL